MNKISILLILTALSIMLLPAGVSAEDDDFTILCAEMGMGNLQDELERNFRRNFEDQLWVANVHGFVIGDDEVDWEYHLYWIYSEAQTFGCDVIL